MGEDGGQPNEPGILVDVGRLHGGDFVATRRTREAFLEHEKSKAELKGLMADDVKEAFGHGIRASPSPFALGATELVRSLVRVPSHDQTP
jgi:hypothetical protein